MGTQTSKPVVEILESREARSRANDFQIISPVSDISNPSEFRKSYSAAPQGLQGLSGGAHDRRRASKVVTKSLCQPVYDIPAPSAFYFPTAESEKYFEQVRASRALPSNEKAKRQGFFSKRSTKNKENAQHESNQQKSGSGVQNVLQPSEGPRRASKGTSQGATKKAESCGQARGSDRSQSQLRAVGSKGRNSDPDVTTPANTTVRNMMMLEEVMTETQNERRSGPSDKNRKKLDRQGRQGAIASRQVEALSKTDNPPLIPSTASRQPFVIRETEGLLIVPESKSTKSKRSNADLESDKRNPLKMHEAYHSIAPSQQARNNLKAAPTIQWDPNHKASDLGLHQEDAYFDRLGGDYSTASPCVRNIIVANLASTLGPPLKAELSSPLFRMSSVLLTSNVGHREGGAQESVSAASTPETSPSKSPAHRSPGNGSLLLNSQVDQSQGNALEQMVEERKSLELYTDEEAEGSMHDESAVIKHFKAILKHAEKQEAPEEVTSRNLSVGASKASANTMVVAESRLLSDEMAPAKAREPLGAKGGKEDMLDLEVPESPSGSESVDSCDDGTYFKPDEMMNAESAFRARPSLPQEPIKQIASLGPSLTTAASKKSSKLETLFCPILPALSDSDARHSTGSYDPYEILVTESAPSVMESGNYRTLCYPPPWGSPAFVNGGGLMSPSLMSVDSQSGGTPSSVRPMVSDQATCNGEFLFTTEYGKQPRLLKHTSDRDSAMFSISTISSRSRLSQRTARSAVTIPISSSQSEDSNESRGGARRVRFSTDEKEAEKHLALPTEKLHVVQDIDFPLIERKVSDLTDTLSEIDARSSVGSFIQRQNTIPEEEYEEPHSTMGNDNESENGSDVEEGKQLLHGSPVARVHWSYREEGNSSAVTPHLKGKGKPISNATNSPFVRFKAAKTKFANDTGKESPIRKASSLPRKIKTRTGSVVSARINELNKRVSDVRKLRRQKRHPSHTSGSSKYTENASMIRTQLILNYNPSAIGAGRFTLPIDDGDQSVISFESEGRTISTKEMAHASKTGIFRNEQPAANVRQSGQNCQARVRGDVELDLDSVSRLSLGSTSIATIRQDKENVQFKYPVTRLSIKSAETNSTASSSLSSIRKQVFRPESTGALSKNKSRISLSSSDGESTTLSSVMNKENANFLPFRAGANVVKPTEQYHPTGQQALLQLSPTQRTPVQARKWRSLAAAAQQKDFSRKALEKGKWSTKGSSGKPKKGLSARNKNQMVLAN
jgi:hypothetical protein